MKDGSIRHVEREPRRVFKKYRDIFDNPIDENYKHNHKIIYNNHLSDLYDEDKIPMPENPPYTESKYNIS